jgi:membrane-bound serine protease (ClpP class)
LAQGVLILIAFLLLLLLPSPWNVIVFTALLPLWLLELLGWNRTMKRRRHAVGAETLIGREGTVIRSFEPFGQVHLDGEIWEAQSGEVKPGIGERVRVVALDGLRLVVERSGSASRGAGSP